MAILTRNLDNEPNFTDGTLRWFADARVLIDTDTNGTSFNPGAGNTMTQSRIRFEIVRINQFTVNNATGERLEFDQCTFAESAGNNTLTTNSEWGRQTAWKFTDCIFSANFSNGAAGFGVTTGARDAGHSVTFELLRHTFRAFGNKTYFVNLSGVGNVDVGGTIYRFSAVDVTYDNGALHTNTFGTTINGASFSGGVRTLGNGVAYTARMIGSGSRPTTSFIANTTFGDAGLYTATEGTGGADVIINATSTWNSETLYSINNLVVPSRLSYSKTNSTSDLSIEECYMSRIEFHDADGVNATDVIAYDFPTPPASVNDGGDDTDASRGAKILMDDSIEPGTQVSDSVAATHIMPSNPVESYIVSVDRKDGVQLIGENTQVIADQANCFLTPALDSATGELAHSVDVFNAKSIRRNIEDVDGNSMTQIQLAKSEFTADGANDITVAAIVHAAPVDAFITQNGVGNLAAARALVTTTADNLYFSAKNAWAYDPDISAVTWGLTVVDGVLVATKALVLEPSADNTYSQNSLTIRAVTVSDDTLIQGLRFNGNLSLAQILTTTVQSGGELTSIPASLTNRNLAGSATLVSGGVYSNVTWTNFNAGTDSILTVGNGIHNFTSDCDFTEVASYDLMPGTSPVFTIVGGTAEGIFGATGLARLVAIGVQFTSIINFTGFVDNDNMNVDLYDVSPGVNPPTFLHSVTSGAEIDSTISALSNLGGSVTQVLAFVRSDSYIPQIHVFDADPGGTATIAITDSTDQLRPPGSTDLGTLVVNAPTLKPGDGMTVTTTNFDGGLLPQGLILATQVRNTFVHSQDCVRVWTMGQTYLTNAESLLFNTSGFMQASPNFTIGPGPGSASQFYAVSDRTGGGVNVTYSFFIVDDGTSSVRAQGAILNSALIDYPRLEAGTEGAVDRAVGTSITRMLLILNYIRSFRLFGIKPQTNE